MPSRRLLFAFAGLVVPSVALLAALAPAGCSTDNGEITYGPDYGPLPKRDGASDEAGDDPREGGTPDPDGAPSDEDGGEEGAAPCANGTIAVLAGDDSSLSGAIQDKNGAWVTSPIAGGAAKSKPALVAFGAGFLGVTHGAGDALQTTSYASGAWTGATAFGNAGVKGAPSLAVAGTKAHVVYSAGPGSNRDYAHGIHDGTSWNAATAKVGSPDFSFGTVSAGLAAVGDEVVFAENGTNHGLYVRSFEASWSASEAISGAGTVGTDFAGTPELVAVEGAFDLLLAYTDNDPSKAIAFATRDNAAPASWKNGGNVAGATTTEKFALSRVGQFTVLLTFRGEDGNGYYTQGTIGSNNVSWSAPKPIGGGAAFAVDSTPAVAKGVCGDDAVVAYASGGVVRVTRLRGTTWTSSESAGTASGRRVAIATK